MSTANTPTNRPQRYQVPTHLRVPDKIGLNFMGLAVEVTIRQGLICVFGGCLTLRLWHMLNGLGAYGAIGAFLHLLLPGLVIAITLVVAMVRIEDRPVEAWLAILLDYAVRPKVYIWKSIIHDPTYRLQYRLARPIEESDLSEEEV